MFRIIKNKRAQAVIGEYVLVFFIAIGVITAMSTYYTNTESETYRSLVSRTSLVDGGSTGIYRKEYDDLSRITTTSATKPPQDADKEYGW